MEEQGMNDWEAEFSRQTNNGVDQIIIGNGGSKLAVRPDTPVCFPKMRRSSGRKADREIAVDTPERKKIAQITQESTLVLMDKRAC